MSSREQILDRIRVGLKRAAAPTAVAGETVQAYMRRRARGPAPVIAQDLTARFSMRARALASTVEHVSTLAAVPQAVAHYLDQAGLPRRAVCWPELESLAWAANGMQVAVRPAVDGDKAGVTGAFCGIAETGTLMLLSGTDVPATVSLLPDVHIAVLMQARLVPSMEDAWDLVRAYGGWPRAVSCISGPSRTADIEQVVTLGAHGPYRLHILLVSS